MPATTAPLLRLETAQPDPRAVGDVRSLRLELSAPGLLVLRSPAAPRGVRARWVARAGVLDLRLPAGAPLRVIFLSLRGVATQRVEAADQPTRLRTPDLRTVSPPPVAPAAWRAPLPRPSGVLTRALSALGRVAPPAVQTHAPAGLLRTPCPPPTRRLVSRLRVPTMPSRRAGEPPR